MGTPTGSSNRGSNSQQPKVHHSVNNSQAFFQHRMSNSNTNLKHVIRSYKEEQQTNATSGNLSQQNIAVESPHIKQIPTSKRSKRQSLTNNKTNSGNNSVSQTSGTQITQPNVDSNGTTNF